MVTASGGIVVKCGLVGCKLYDIQALKAIGKQINEIESSLVCVRAASDASIAHRMAVPDKAGNACPVR